MIIGIVARKNKLTITSLSWTFKCSTCCYLAALYFVAVATAAALIGQHLVRKLIAILGRASLIIFILALTIFVSAISLGKCIFGELFFGDSLFIYIFFHFFRIIVLSVLIVIN